MVDCSRRPDQRHKMPGCRVVNLLIISIIICGICGFFAHSRISSSTTVCWSCWCPSSTNRTTSTCATFDSAAFTFSPSFRSSASSSCGSSKASKSLQSLSLSWYHTKRYYFVSVATVNIVAPFRLLYFAVFDFLLICVQTAVFNSLLSCCR